MILFGRRFTFGAYKHNRCHPAEALPRASRCDNLLVLNCSGPTGVSKPQTLVIKVRPITSISLHLA